MLELIDGKMQKITSIPVPYIKFTYDVVLGEDTRSDAAFVKFILSKKIAVKLIAMDAGSGWPELIFMGPQKSIFALIKGPYGGESGGFDRRTIEEWVTEVDVKTYKKTLKTTKTILNKLLKFFGR